MSRTQTRVVIGLLMVVHFVADVVLVPIGLVADSRVAMLRLTLMTFGIFLAQPALLALWAALAPQALPRRLGQSLAMLACIYLATDFAAAQNSGGSRDPNEVVGFANWLVAFVVCQVPPSFLRGRFRWQVVPPRETTAPTDNRSHQFSLSTLLGGMAAVAVFLAAVRWLHPRFIPPSELPSVLLDCAATGLITSLPGMLVILTCWLILLPGARCSWRWFVGLGGSIAVVATATAEAIFGSQDDIGELIFIVPGLLLSAAASLWVVRICGYRLVRRLAAERTGQDAVFDSENRKFRRFALVVSAMLFVLAGLTALAPARLRLWSELAEQRRWRDLGFSISSRGHNVVAVYSLDEMQSLDDKVIDRIGQFGWLEALSLSSSDADDDTLRRLPALAELTSLLLFCTQVSDEGLAQLAKFRKLETVNLQMTDIGDGGLEHLAVLKGPGLVDLRHTRVTPEGARRLKRSRPDLTIQATADDASLAQIASHFRRRRSGLSQPEVPSQGMLHLHAKGNQVTDVGITALRDMTQLVELDLEGAQVTDAAINDLVTLTGLKRLILVETQITDAGAARLQRELPDCAITR